MTAKYLLYLFALVIVTVGQEDVFKKCKESDFCNRLRYKSEKSGYIVNISTVSRNSRTISFVLLNTRTSKNLYCTIDALEKQIYRIIIDEPKPSPRFRLNDDALQGTPKFGKFDNIKVDENIEIYNNEDKIIIFSAPFKIEFYRKNKLISIINSEDRLTIETDEPNTAIALDIHFPEAERAYGIPEHADHLALRTTNSNLTDPYRLFNLDVAHYKLESTVALYGAIPILYAHGKSHTTGIFWHNAAETWVEIENGNLVKTYLISESGVLDLFVLTGGSPKETVLQYVSLTGTAPLPQYFTLAHHQSRWNYLSQEDVKTVVAEFDNHDFPLDVIWLDIEYTDDKKYFTWNPNTFSNPLEMQQNLTATNRKLVTIIDPHFKKQVGYFVYDEALSRNYFVKNQDGTIFEGHCWPGTSSYLDFLNPEVQDFFANLYSFDIFKGSTENTYIWNDMNEPSVFNDLIEKTLPKDIIHHGNIKHRDVHNIYGFYQTKATFKGLLNRSHNKKRPFVLTRSHFAGSQRYAAVWTGDNTAEWNYLASSIPMCLSEALAGISFCGADVGGFFYNPTVELLQRWYQIGAWLPFFRAHAHIETDRREPYLFPENIQTRIRISIRQRYAHLPFWYTQFYEHEVFGEPVIRPLFYNYNEDTNVLDIESQFLIGTQVMVAPVLEPNANMVNVYFPGGNNTVWYDIDDYTVHRGMGYQPVNVTLDKIPVYYRSGCIIFRKDLPRPTSVDMIDDPFTLYILLNDKQFAKGTLYLDDLESFNYRHGEFSYIQVIAENNTIRNILHNNGNYKPNAKIHRIVFVNAPNNIRIANIITSGSTNKTLVKYKINYLEINGIDLDLTESFMLQLL